MKIKSVADAKDIYANTLEISAFGAMMAVRGEAVYKEGQWSEANREKLRGTLKKEAYAIIKHDDYRKKGKRISVTKHRDNIVKFANRVTAECKGFLARGKLRFGLAQKYLNVELKLLWCQGKYPEPPHCPFDGYVLRKLRPQNACWAWTKCTHPGCYRKWVQAFEDNYERLMRHLERLAELKEIPENDAKTIAEWEVVFWEWRRKR